MARKIYHRNCREGTKRGENSFIRCRGYRCWCRYVVTDHWRLTRVGANWYGRELRARRTGWESYLSLCGFLSSDDERVKRANAEHAEYASDATATDPQTPAAAACGK